MEKKDVVLVGYLFFPILHGMFSKQKRKISNIHFIINDLVKTIELIVSQNDSGIVEFDRK